MVILFLIGIVICAGALYVADHSDDIFDIQYVLCLFFVFGEFFITLGILRGLYIYLK